MTGPVRAKARLSSTVRGQSRLKPFAIGNDGNEGHLLDGMRGDFSGSAWTRQPPKLDSLDPLRHDLEAPALAWSAWLRLERKSVTCAHALMPFWGL